MSWLAPAAAVGGCSNESKNLLQLWLGLSPSGLLALECADTAASL